MRVRRLVGASGTAALLVLLGAPAWAEETPGPDPSPGVEDPSGGPANDPGCTLVDPGGDTPTDDGTVTAEPEPTDEPPVEVTEEPTEEPTDEPTGEPGPEATVDPEPTGDPEPTLDPEPTGEPDPSGDPEPTDGPMWVCTGVLAFTGGEGGVEKDTTTLAVPDALPRTGAPVGTLAATGLLMIVGGAGSVVLARRRTG